MSHTGSVRVLLELLASALVLLMVLTGTGQLRRGGSRVTTLLAAAFFPVTWVAWYVVDRRSGTPSTL